MRFPRKLAGLLLAAGMAASAATAATAAPAKAVTGYIFFGTDTPGPPYMCLEADPAPDFRYRVTTQPCNYQNNPAQQWTEYSDGGFTKFRNNAVGWCMDAHVPTPTLANAPVILWDCSATFSDDRWEWDGTGLGFGTLHSRAWNSNGYCLSVPGGQSLPGLWTQLKACTSTGDPATTLISLLVPTS